MFFRPSRPQLRFLDSTLRPVKPLRKAERRFFNSQLYLKLFTGVASQEPELNTSNLRQTDNQAKHVENLIN